jgi:hypothetical protein
MLAVLGPTLTTFEVSLSVTLTRPGIAVLWGVTGFAEMLAVFWTLSVMLLGNAITNESPGASALVDSFSNC